MNDTVIDNSDSNEYIAVGYTEINDLIAEGYETRKILVEFGDVPWCVFIIPPSIPNDESGNV